MNFPKKCEFWRAKKWTLTDQKSQKVMITRSQLDEIIEQEFDFDALPFDRRQTVREYLTGLFPFQWHNKTNKVSLAFSSGLIAQIDDQSDK